MRRLAATILLPLSLIPVALAVPYVADQHEDFRARYIEREALTPPAVGRLAPASVPVYRDQVPVLVYHGLNADGGRWNVSPTAFARHMAALDAAGFHTLDAHTYARFARGEDVDLPPRPILITFDDGRLDSFRGADAVLEQHDFRATMFAIAGATVDASRTYLSADELSDMEASGRWDIQFHAGDGHKQIETASGRTRPFYGGLEPGESLAEFDDRVQDDLDNGREQLADMVPGAELGDLFSVPYSDYGQAPGGELPIAVTSLRSMTSRFTAVFIQRSELHPTRRGQHGLLTRYEPKPDTTPKDLLRVLRRGTADKEA